MNKPNIVFFFSDQQRWDTCGCYGQELDITPNLDKMADNGVLFTNAYTAQPVCGPARAMLQTGKYPTETGCYRNDIALREEKTLATRMKDAGYDVGYVGKWHLASTGGIARDVDIEEDTDYQTVPIPLERRGGYDGYWRGVDLLEFTSHSYDGHVYDENNNRVELEGYRADAITDFGLEYIDMQSKEKPFFLFMSLIEPHHQNDNNCYEGPKGSKEKYKDFKVPEDLKGFDGDYMKEYPDYLGCCNSVDYNLGRVMEKLKEKGLDENTIVIFTSDHGSHFRTRNTDSDLNGYDDYKRSCHDSCLHIPMVIAGGKFAGGIEVEELVSLVSLPKTIMNLAGVDIGDAMQGENLEDLLGIPDTERRDVVFSQISESRVGRSIRTRKWKYAVVAPDKDGNEYSRSDIYREEFLYDLAKDPYEKNNLVADPEYAGVRDKLAAMLKVEMEVAGEAIPEILPA